MSVSQRFARSWFRAWSNVGIAVRALSWGTTDPLDFDGEACAWLDAHARMRDPRVDGWLSIRSTSRVRSYRCNVCGVLIDTESAQHRSTRHAHDALQAHAREHLTETSRERTLARVLAGVVDIRDLEPDEQVALDAAMEGGAR